MAAAVADFRLGRTAAGKLERGDGLVARARADADVLAALAARRPGQVLVGFAAETGDGIGARAQKRVRKGVDLIVLNDVSRADIGFDAIHNEVALVGADGVQHVPSAPKRAVAGAVSTASKRCSTVRLVLRFSLV